ncbi:TatD family hydrolase [uncultured Oscillibacter sp.]|uniref:TatD family hydrolase n=1 Tax=uncultured Oscillibacter sp. TaxID=876091 RepID=UPI0025CE0F70|nr:TatD family hydrolase [uncultured Oscillibacter sp.]
MYYIDAHAHLTDLSISGLKEMALHNIGGIVSPVHLGTFKPVSRDTVVDMWDVQVEKQLGRARQNLIDAWAMIGISMVSTPRDGLEDLLALLPGYLARPEVVAVGEVGFEPGSRTNSDPAYQQMLLERQADIVREAGVVIDIHVPNPPDRKIEATKRSLEICRERGVEMSKVVIDHCTEANIDLVLEAGAHAAISVQPWRVMTPENTAELILKGYSERVMVDSDSSDLISDPLAVAKVAFALRTRGADEALIEKVCCTNCRAAYGI